MSEEEASIRAEDPSPLPAGRIDHPEGDSGLESGRVLAGGWALSDSGPPSEVLILINGRRTVTVPVGGPSPAATECHPGVPGSDRAGWSTWLDLPEAPMGVDIALLARVDPANPGAMVTLDERHFPPPAIEAGGSSAVFTIVQNEATFLPVWLDHYSRSFAPNDIYVLDHGSTDGGTEGLEGRCNLLRVAHDATFDHTWLRAVVQDFQSFLLRSYDQVLFAEADELVVADPATYDGLGDYLRRCDRISVACTGYEVAERRGEAPIDFDRPLLAQRSHWRRSGLYSKRLLSRIPLRWNVGFHDEYNAPPDPPDPELLLLHLHRVDYQLCLDRHRASTARRWSEEDLRWNLGWQQRVVDPEEFDAWFYSEDYDRTKDTVEPIPERFRDLF